MISYGMTLIPDFGMNFLEPLPGLDSMVQIIIVSNPPINNDIIYLFDISPEGFNHMFGEIQEYPDIEYVDKINEDDNDDDQNGRLRIIGVDIV